MRRGKLRDSRWAFTLLELLVVVIVLAILAMLTLPIVRNTVERSRRVTCTANLKTLYVGTESYLTIHDGYWPQINPGLIKSAPHEYARLWMEALQEYVPSKRSWICPEVQTLLKNPDYEHNRKQLRVDYLACPFDDKQNTARRMVGQPWFIERADVHGAGNLLVMGDGQVMDLGAALLKR